MTDSEKLDRILDSLGGLHERIGRVEERIGRVEADLRAIRKHLEIDAEQTNLATATAAAGVRRRA